MSVHDLNEFIRLSTSLNFQLSAAVVSWEDVLENILDGKPVPTARQAVETVEFLHRLEIGGAGAGQSVLFRLSNGPSNGRLASRHEAVDVQGQVQGMLHEG